MGALALGDFELVTADGVLRYAVSGDGPACIVLSGGPGIDPRYMGDLGGLGDTITMVRLHPRGAGLSRHPDDSDWSLPAYARDVEALRTHLGLERPLVLGHSHGGMIALQYAHDNPAAAGALVLVDTSASVAGWDRERAMAPYAGEPWFERARAAMDAEPATAEEAAAVAAECLPFYFASLTPAAREFLGRAAATTVNPAPMRGFNIREMDLRPFLPAMCTPTLVVVGRHDYIQTVDMATAIADGIPGARLVVFERSGHFPWIEERARFHDVVRDFITSLAP